MRLSIRPWLLPVMILSVASLTASQTEPAHKPVASKRYCQSDGGFCFKYPASWTMLGEVFDGNGVVVAPPQKQERALWDAITIARIAPPPQGDEEPFGLDGVVEQATASLREAGQAFETLQRQQRTVDHKPAQMLKVRYQEKPTGHEWIEKLVFIEGPDNEIYSVALKCSPQDLSRLEPVLAGVLSSWTLPEPEVPDDNAPKPSAPPAKATQPH